MIVVEAHGLSKTFMLPHEQRTTLKEHFLHPLHRVELERNEVLREVSFDVGRGEFFSIIGANGSGKSTLLKLIAGIYRPDSGSIRVEGAMSPFIELGVGFNMELTARDNIRINATLLGMSKRELDERFEDIVGFSELERFIDQKLKNFSSGMQVRLAYAIAIQVEFDILLLDEVLAVGDQSFQEKCMATFERLREQEKTIVFVSHEMQAVRQFSDRVLHLHDGRVNALGDAGDVVDRYMHEVHTAQTV